MRYTEWGTIKQAIEKKLGRELCRKEWRLLQEFLFSAAVHPPCNDSDIEFACKKLVVIKRVLETTLK